MVEHLESFHVTAIIALECRDDACAPPPVGTGGSLPGDSPSGAGKADPGQGAMAGMRRATDADRKARKIPPNLKDVYVSEDPKAALYAIGKDAKGRSQYLYSAEHKGKQAAAKYARVKELASRVGKLDDAIKRDAMTDDTAAATALIRHFGLRPGSDADTKSAKKAYGATTLQARHVRQYPETGRTTLSFVGKSGVKITVTTRDPSIFAMVEERLKTKSGTESLFDTSGADVRAYMDSALGDGFLPKDLRTLKANVMALDMVDTMRRPKTKTAFRKARNKVADAVSKQLGNTRAQSLQSYINPTVFAAWEAALGETS